MFIAGAIFPGGHGGAYWLTFAVEQLAYYDNYSGQLVYQLATDMQEDFEAQTITVTLRDGVLFHDGSKLDAEAAVWNLQVYYDNNNGMIGSPASLSRRYSLSSVSASYSLWPVMKTWRPPSVAMA